MEASESPLEGFNFDALIKQSEADEKAFSHKAIFLPATSRARFWLKKRANATGKAGDN